VEEARPFLFQHHKNVISFELECRRCLFFPVRHGGSVYVGSESIREMVKSPIVSGCLGRDFYLIFLYEN